MVSHGTLRARPSFAPADVSRLVHHRVVRIHAGEAEFLWTQRTAAIRSSNHALRHLARVDARLLAHLRGLELAGAAGWEAAREELANLSAGSVFVASYLAYGRQHRESMLAMLQLVLGQPEVEAGFVDALCWLEPSSLNAPLARLAASSLPTHRRFALTVCAFHRRVDEAQVAAAAEDADPTLRAQALRSIGELKMTAFAPVAHAADDDADGACRFWGAYASALLGSTDHAVRTWELRDQPGGDLDAAREIAFRFADRAWATEAIRDLLRSPESRRNAIQAIGILGDPASVPWLIDQMEGPHACVAGEAYAAITGADMELLDLRRDPPEDAPERHPDDDDLPWPEPHAVRAHWAQCAAMSGTRERCLGGLLASASAALQVLRTGFQRQRAGAAFERMRHDPGTGLFPYRARADWQSGWLST
jgi:uncharacterized protein (TIGR02270 family)